MVVRSVFVSFPLAIVLSWLVVFFGPPVRSTNAEPTVASPLSPLSGTQLALSERVTDRVRAQFPQTRHWFRIVAGAHHRLEHDGRLVPDYNSLTHPRVRRADNAGHTIVPRFPTVFDAPTRIASGEDADVWIELSPLAGRHVPALQEDGLIVYPNAFADTDVMFKSTPTHVDEYLYLRTPRAPTEWRYHIVQQGPAIVAVRQAGNAIELIDTQGVARLRASRPVVFDARGQRREGTITLRDSTLVVRIDDRDLQYPLLVDPDWASTGDMAWGRFYFRANVLPDGRVLVTGGCSASVCSGDLTLPACRTVVRAAETLDLSSRTWSSAGDDAEPRFFHAAVSLTNGNVLVAGGCTNPDCTNTTANARIYDPARRTFVPIPDLAEARAGMVSARLPDGRILIAGGCNNVRCTNRAEIFDPASQRWTPTASMREPRGRAEVVTLADGRILAVGGCTDIVCNNVLASAEVYDPTTQQWTPTAPMHTPRAGHHATLLSDGRVFVGGGCPDQRCSAFLRSTEFFDPATLRWTPGPDQLQPRLGARAARLPDGTVMINQGCASRSDCDLTNERFYPDTRSLSMMERAVTTRAFHELVIHERARMAIAIGGCQPGTCSWWNETYDLSGIRPAPVDAGTSPDATVQDAHSQDATNPPDATSPMDSTPGAEPSPPPRSHCGCRTVGTTSPEGLLTVLLAASMTLLARRRLRHPKHESTVVILTTTVLSACGQPNPTDAGPDSAEVASNDATLDAPIDAHDDTPNNADSSTCKTNCGACQTCRDGQCITLGSQGIARAIGIGWNHSLAIATDGALLTWGANGFGELGQGDRSHRNLASMVNAPDTRWRVVAAGSRHSCGIQDDGSLWCWGVNVHGQLGVGDTTERLSPTRVGTESDWIEVQCGGLHTCGIRADGSLWCWGANPAGQLGLGMRTGDQWTPQRVGTLTGWRRLAAKARFNCALRPDDSLWCWGDNSDGQLGTGDTMDRLAPTQVLPGQRWTWVRQGPLHTCAINTEGALYCWGANGSGQLGNGTTTGSRVPVQVGTERDWVVVSAGFDHTCGIRQGGRLYCWGSNSAGQLGLGDTTMRTTPTPVHPTTAYREVLLGMAHTCALREDGQVQCWGENTWGQVGDGSNTPRRSPATVCFAR